MDNKIQITILEIDRNKIRIGVIADPNIPVCREEIYESMNGHPFVPYQVPPFNPPA